MTKTAAISVRVSPEIKAAVEREASAEYRTQASLVEKILIEWLRGRGALAANPRSQVITTPETRQKGKNVYVRRSRRRG